METTLPPRKRFIQRQKKKQTDHLTDKNTKILAHSFSVLLNNNEITCSTRYIPKCNCESHLGVRVDQW